MMTTTLNALAIDVVGQYAVAGKHLVRAYRAGTERLVARINDGYAKFVGVPALPAHDEAFRTSLVGAQRQLTGFLVGGVARATEQADLAIDRVTDTTTEGLKRLSSVAERYETVIGAPAVEAVTKANLPVARLSLTVAGQVAEGSKRLADQLAGGGAAVAAVDAAAEAVAEVAAGTVEAFVEATKSRARRAA